MQDAGLRIPMDPFSEIGLYAETRDYPKTDVTQMEFTGPIDVDALAEAWEESVALVPTFSSHLAIERVGAQFLPVWHSCPGLPNRLVFQDYRASVRQPFDPTVFLEQSHGQRLLRRIDLTRAFPVRAFLFRTFNDRHIFSIRYQHSVMDPYKGYLVTTAMLARYHEKVTGAPPTWASALGMASLGDSAPAVPAKPGPPSQAFAVEALRGALRRLWSQGRITPVLGERQLAPREAVGRHSLRIVIDDPRHLQGLFGRARRGGVRLNDLLLAAIHEGLEGWNREHGVNQSRFRMMLVTSLKGRLPRSRNLGAGISGISMVTGENGDLGFEERMRWFGSQRRALLAERYDVRFHQWVTHSCGASRFLPFALRRRLWRQIIGAIPISVYLSNVGVVWPRMVDGRPTGESQLLGAGEFSISDIHSSPSISPGMSLGITARTHNRRMYLNFVCDRFRFRRHEAQGLTRAVHRALLNAV